MDGTSPLQILQRNKDECSSHERHSGQVFRLWLSARQSALRLVNSLSKPSRFYYRRSYLRTFGGYC